MAPSEASGRTACVFHRQYVNGLGPDVAWAWRLRAHINPFLQAWGVHHWWIGISTGLHGVDGMHCIHPAVAGTTVNTMLL